MVFLCIQIWAFWLGLLNRDKNLLSGCAPRHLVLLGFLGCVEDAIILYSILADGCNPDCPSLRIPQLTIEPQPLNGLRMGVFWDVRFYV